MFRPEQLNFLCYEHLGQKLKIGGKKNKNIKIPILMLCSSRKLSELLTGIHWRSPFYLSRAFEAVYSLSHKDLVQKWRKWLLMKFSTLSRLSLLFLHDFWENLAFYTKSHCFCTRQKGQINFHQVFISSYIIPIISLVNNS